LTRRRWFPYACIASAVLLANALGLAHFVTTNPLTINAGLTNTFPQWLHGYPTADPNSGFLMQALGHLISADWLSGRIPWWNPYEGIGVPLAADMQSGAFFPPTLLFGMADGLQYVQILLELIAGWCTYALLIRLDVGRTLAVAGGVAFALCGTFAWFAIEPIRVMTLLPVCLIGIERILSAAKAERPWGWRLLAVGLAGSFLGGFPETFLLDSVFVVAWAGLRLAGPGRDHIRTVVAKLGAAGATALTLVVPLAVAFAGYLRFADTGNHGAGGYAHVSIPVRHLAQLVLPYSIGPITGFRSPGALDEIGVFWGNVGGYLDGTLLAAAVVGVVGRRNRILRLGLVAWLVVCLAQTYGFSPVVEVLANVPLLRLTAFYRYADPTWEMAAVVLAILGLDDIARHRTRFRVLVVGVSLSASGSVVAAVVAFRALTPAVGASGSMELHRHWFAVGSLGLALGCLAVLLAGGWLAASRPHGALAHSLDHQPAEPIRTVSGVHQRWGRMAMVAAVSVEAIVLLGFTYLSAPRPTRPHTETVAWLQVHLGTYRFATLGPIQPNYGSYYRIAGVNVNELPLPRAYTRYVATSLDTNIIPFEFTGGYVAFGPSPSPAQEYGTHMAAFEAIGVRYVVVAVSGVDPTGSPFPPVGTSAWPTGPRLVHTDILAKVWELPNPAAAFSLDVPTHVRSSTNLCRVAVVGWDEARVTCHRPTTLVRKVQFAPGWTADVGGTPIPVRQATTGPPGLFQEVSVPPGTTSVRFTYLPPGEWAAVPVAVLAWLGLGMSCLITWRRDTRRRQRPRGELRASTGTR